MNAATRSADCYGDKAYQRAVRIETNVKWNAILGQVRQLPNTVRHRAQLVVIEIESIISKRAMSIKIKRQIECVAHGQVREQPNRVRYGRQLVMAERETIRESNEN